MRGEPHPAARRVADKTVPAGAAHGPYNDPREHNCTYAVWPQAGDVVDGPVDRAGHALNTPLQWVAAGSQRARSGAPLSSQRSWLQIETDGQVPGQIILEAMKQTEDGKDWIVRLSEAHGCAASVRLTIDLPLKGVERVDLMERSFETLAIGQPLCLDFDPFQLQTLRLVLET